MPESTQPTGCPVTSRNGTALPSCCRTRRLHNWTRLARWPIPGATTTPIFRPVPIKRGILRTDPSEDVELKYGKEYEFRVRLGDLSGGGPLVDRPGTERCAGYQFFHRLQTLRRAEAVEGRSRTRSPIPAPLSFIKAIRSMSHALVWVIPPSSSPDGYQGRFSEADR